MACLQHAACKSDEHPQKAAHLPHNSAVIYHEPVIGSCETAVRNMQGYCCDSLVLQDKGNDCRRSHRGPQDPQICTRKPSPS